MADKVSSNKNTTSPKFGFKRANRFLPHIALIGIGIGTANFMLNGELNWLQWVIQALSTSFIIGYSTLLIALNKSWFRYYVRPIWKLYGLLFLIFVLAGLFATELEHIFRSLIFYSEPFSPFSAGKMYMFNAVISLFLGFSLFGLDLFFKNTDPIGSENQEIAKSQKEGSENSASPDITLNIPVKDGDNILLIPLQDIVYFEAYDNYSFVHDVNGKKKLCDYSLIFLEKRLDEKFSRIHRKYIVNKKYIRQIKPHLNGRYLIEFSFPNIPTIYSSKSYSNTIRKLIKID